MDVEKSISEYMQNVHVQVSVVGFTAVPREWKHHNHVTANNVLYYILAGEGYIRINEEEFYPQPHQLFLLPAGSRISFHTSASNLLVQYYCHFDIYVGDVPFFQLVKARFSYSFTHSQLIEQLFQKMLAAYKSNNALCHLHIKASFFELLTHIFADKHGLAITMSDGQRANQYLEIISYIDEHIAEPLTVERMADYFNYSTKYFFRYFKSVSGVTPHQYIMRKKTERAKWLLNTTHLTTEQIANELGMDRSHFSKMFRKYTNMTPYQYRVLHNKVQPQ